MRFFKAENLFSESYLVGAEGVERGGGEIVAVVRGVDGGERILGRENVVDARGAEVFADGLQRTAENLRDAAEIGGARRRSGPEIEQRLDAGSGGGAGGCVGDEGGGGLVQMLAKAFIVGEEESLVGSERTASGGAELVALERRSGALVEEVGGVEGVVAQEFKGSAMPLVAAGLRDDDDLAAGMFAELGTIGVALHVEFAHSVDAEQHAAGAAGLHVIFGGAGVLDTVEEKEILLGTITGHGEIVGSGGIGDAGASGFLGSEIDDAGIEREEKVVAAAVEGEILDLLLADEAGDVAGGGADEGGVGVHVDLGFDGADLQSQVDSGFLSDGQMDADASGVLEAGLCGGDFVAADGKS